MNLEVTDIQRGCIHDGPGIRTTVFLKGCPLRCSWCHNPETQKTKKQIFFSDYKCIGCMNCFNVCQSGAHKISDGGEHIFDANNCTGSMKCTNELICPTKAIEPVSVTMSTQSIMEQVLKDKEFYAKNGGITISGGEPTLQTQGLLELMDIARKEGINVCLDTCGAFSSSIAEALVKRVDLFLFDIKITDSLQHEMYTEFPLKPIVERLLEIDKLCQKTIMRCVIIPKLNMFEMHSKQLGAIYKQLNYCEYIELLPYHPYGISKYEKLGLNKENQQKYETPTKKQMYDFASYLLELKIPVKLYGSMI